MIVTSGFLEATQGHGFEQLAEWQATGHTIAIDQYFDGFGAGNGTELKEAGKTKPVLFPEVRFYTNDSWGIIRGVAAAKGFPIVLMNHYSKGTLYLWTMPENFGDLYSLPQPMVTRIKQYLFADQPSADRLRPTMLPCSPMTMARSSSKITATRRRTSGSAARARPPLKR